MRIATNWTDTSRAIRLVFEHRKTPLRLPMQFDSSALEALQQYWGRYHKTATAAARLPSQIVEVIEVINMALSKSKIGSKEPGNRQKLNPQTDS